MCPQLELWPRSSLPRLSFGCKNSKGSKGLIGSVEEEAVVTEIRSLLLSSPWMQKKFCSVWNRSSRRVVRRCWTWMIYWSAGQLGIWCTGTYTSCGCPQKRQNYHSEWYWANRFPITSLKEMEGWGKFDGSFRAIWHQWLNVICKHIILVECFEGMRELIGSVEKYDYSWSFMSSTVEYMQVVLRSRPSSW